MLEINWADVQGVLETVRPHLITLGVVAALAVIAMIACLKLPKPKKFLIRAEAGLAIFLALVIVVNAICLGPMSSMIDLATGSGSISEETSNEALTLAEDVAREGIVLLQNDGGTLPLARDAKPWSWALWTTTARLRAWCGVPPLVRLALTPSAKSSMVQ